jgi:dTMP kinase
MKPGRFITLEGLEGVGKTTNLEFILNWLKNHDIPFYQTREPGGTPLAEEIRALLLAHRTEPMSALCELSLVFAARAQHLAQVIRPQLASGHWVISDRFTDASYAYQGAGRGLSEETIYAFEQLIHGDLQPDLTILLDAPVAIGLARAQARGAADRFEQEQADFFERARVVYLNRAHHAPERFRIVDASQPLEQVQVDIADALGTLL